MKRKYTFSVIVFLAFLILVVGFVSADPSIPAKNETQGLKIYTVASVEGSLNEDNEAFWETSTGVLDNQLDLLEPSDELDDDIIIWPLPGDLDPFEELHSPGEVQYYTVYTEDTSGIDGHIGYTNNFALDTGNQAMGESNIEVTRGIVFMTDLSGSLSSTENLILDGAGQFNYADDALICPFGSGSDFIPAFCNKVEMGSDLLISSGTVTTDTSEKFVSKSSDDPVTTDYYIQVTGLDDPAEGSVSAHVNVLAREGAVTELYEITNDPTHGTFYVVSSDLVSELKIDEVTSVSGQIDLFEKTMHYESGLTL